MQRPPGRTVIVALGVVAALAGVWLGLRSPEPLPVEVRAIAGSPVSPGPSDGLVHVSGAVGSPGLVAIRAGDRVADALAAAGGVLPEADLTAVNLADPVADGQQIVVPVGGSAPPGAAPSGGATADDGLVHLNSATVVDLQRLPGVGEVLAARIVAYRDANGPFSTVEDLLSISGIGERKLEGLRDMAAVP